ncbi:hypothetical protein [Luteibacter aegosomatissinici]|uniref:hypothetical protein n=1 Tax=Luteibacter aegosomatissinici TaxID=2911539 RepID=UPI001FFA84CF|nr:hypothetical protein [Luteibacter aegosomatissinici]UPG94121.1 hypothetical protein L2Y97_20220 [Luteibacter aegosomatissinici]
MTQSFDLPYFPRGPLVEEVLQILTSGLKQGVTLFAPRRQGKTSFVRHELIPAANDRGWQTLYIDLWRRRGEPELALVEALEGFLESRQSGWRRKLRFKEFKAKASAGAATIESTLEPVGFAADPVLENRLDVALTALADKGVTLLILDEVQALAGAKREDFVAALRTVIQKLQGKLLVFYTGSSRDGLNSMFRQQKAPLFASAMAVQLPDLGDAFIEDRLSFLRLRTQAVVSKQALDAAFETLGRTPEFLNEVILHLLIAGNGDIDAAMGRWVHAQNDTGLGSVLDELKPLELGVMNLLAQPAHPSVYSSEALEWLSARINTSEKLTPARVQAALKKLMRMELVGPTGRHGEYEIEDRATLLQLRAIDANQ